MPSPTPPPIRAVPVWLWVLIVLVACGITGWWLRAQHTHTEAIDTATRFVAAVRAGRHDQAFDLTLKAKGLAGRTLAEFEQRTVRQVMGGAPMVIHETSPFQSNGNRLRRWLTGVEIEMPEITVHMDLGALPVKVALRRDADGHWRVFNCQATAG